MKPRHGSMDAVGNASCALLRSAATTVQMQSLKHIFDAMYTPVIGHEKSVGSDFATKTAISG